jgi:hypothetical protein
MMDLRHAAIGTADVPALGGPVHPQHQASLISRQRPAVRQKRVAAFLDVLRRVRAVGKPPVGVPDIGWPGQRQTVQLAVETIGSGGRDTEQVGQKPADVIRAGAELLVAVCADQILHERVLVVRRGQEVAAEMGLGVVLEQGEVQLKRADLALTESPPVSLSQRSISQKI